MIYHDQTCIFIKYHDKILLTVQNRFNNIVCLAKGLSEK